MTYRIHAGVHPVQMTCGEPATDFVAGEAFRAKLMKPYDASLTSRQLREHRIDV